MRNGEELLANDCEALVNYISAKILPIGNLENNPKEPTTDKLSWFSFRNSLELVFLKRRVFFS